MIWLVLALVCFILAAISAVAPAPPLGRWSGFFGWLGLAFFIASLLVGKL